MTAWLDDRAREFRVSVPALRRWASVVAFAESVSGLRGWPLAEDLMRLPFGTVERLVTLNRADPIRAAKLAAIAVGSGIGVREVRRQADLASRAAKLTEAEARVTGIRALLHEASQPEFVLLADWPASYDGMIGPDWLVVTRNRQRSCAGVIFENGSPIAIRSAMTRALALTLFCNCVWLIWTGGQPWIPHSVVVPFRAQAGTAASSVGFCVGNGLALAGCAVLVPAVARDNPSEGATLLAAIDSTRALE